MQRFLARLPRVSITEQMLTGWPRGARRVIDEFAGRYGLPHEATPDALVWYFAGPWKRTVVHRRGALHRFPFRHRDYLEQTLDIHVPLEACAQLVAFNGSVLVDRTRGEVTVYCQDEATNFVLMNLVHNIALGKATAQEARSACASAAEALRRGWPVASAQGLAFLSDTATREGVLGTADPDRELKALPVNPG
jgi:hypothetical protein